MWRRPRSTTERMVGKASYGKMAVRLAFEALTSALAVWNQTCLNARRAGAPSTAPPLPGWSFPRPAMGILAKRNCPFRTPVAARSRPLRHSIPHHRRAETAHQAVKLNVRGVAVRDNASPRPHRAGPQKVRAADEGICPAEGPAQPANNSGPAHATVAFSLKPGLDIDL